MRLRQTLQKHGATFALFGLVIIPLLVRGGSPPRPEECPGGEWVQKHDSCNGDFWKCEGGSNSGDTSSVGRLPLAFEKNAGQAGASFQYVSRSYSHTVLLSDGDAALELRSPTGPVSLRLELDSNNPAVTAEAEERLPGLTNYFIGADPNAWLTNVPSYSRIRYREVYPGIDVIYYGHEGQLEHDFVLRPGADPNLIKMRFTGSTNITLEADGSATVFAGERQVTWKRPVIYQGEGAQRRTVEGRYSLDEKGKLGFAVAAYDRRQPLIIDPVISYSTYIGRSSGEGGARMGVDAAGNAVVVGFTMDPLYPRTQGAFSAGAGAGNTLITKLNAEGTAVIFSTYLGGTNVDGALSMALDRTGNIYIAGSTSSPDFPVTAGVLKPQLFRPGGTIDRFDCTVTKLNAAGSALLYSTYLGGSGLDACIGIAVDPAGNAYVTGNTDSSNFPTDEDAPQRTVRGLRDGFIAKLNPTATTLVYSTLIGGNSRDSGIAIAVDSTGAAYVVGNSASTFGFPVTAGAFQRVNNGTTATSSITGDAFALKLNPAGKEFVYSTFLGGRLDELAFSVAIDGQGNAYVAGNTTSDNFPTTASAFQRTYRGLGGNDIYRGGDAFVAKLNATGSALIYSTFLGGAKDDWATGIVVDTAGNVHVVGSTLSTDFPITQDAHQRTFGGTSPDLTFATGDAFVAQLNAAGSALIYSTYLGGSRDEIGYGIALDGTGALLVTGQTRSSNFPVTAGVAQGQFGGTDTDLLPIGDVFVTRFAGSGSSTGGSVTLSGVSNSASYAANGVSPGEIVVLFGSGIGPSNLTLGNFGATLSGTRVLFDEVAAPIYYVSAGQTSAIVPYGVAARPTVQVVVEYQGQRSAPLSLPVLAASPGLFSASGTGAGPGAILNENSSVNTPANPSQRGRIVVLFGTGAGQTNPPGVDGLIAATAFPKPVLPVTVTIGGRTADILYVGAAPNLVAGVLQLNVKVPEDVPPGNAEVIVTVGTARSQPGLTVAVRE